MKVESISIQNFKRLKDLEISFLDADLDEVRNRFLILGDNGMGKTTLLQAIALPLSLCMKNIADFRQFNWNGWLPEHYFKGGDPRIELSIRFEEDELAATQEIAHMWYDSRPADYRNQHTYVAPGSSSRVKLVLNGDYWRVGNSREEALQFQGRHYARSLLSRKPEARDYFQRLPGMFWFDQFRNLSNQQHHDLNDSGSERTRGGIASLRQYLVDWKLRQGNAGSGDYLSVLERLFQQIFPNHSFDAVRTVPNDDAPGEEERLFILNDGEDTYELVEMSAGEQAIFPVLYEIVRQAITRSVVLIDEIDLNLHPPLAQRLVSILPMLAPDCQFIMTTHSEAVNAVMGEAQTYRLKGGNLCL